MVTKQTISLEMDPPTFVVALATRGTILFCTVAVLYYVDGWVRLALS